MRRRFFFFFSLFLTFFSLSDAKPPELSAHATRVKIEEILRAHVSCQELSLEIVQRALSNFLEELDPQKSYLIGSDVAGWVDPSEGLLEAALEGVLSEDFALFFEMHGVMVEAIKRRNLIESKAELLALPQDVKPSEFKQSTWVKSEEELLERLLRIRALQFETADKFEPGMKERFFQRLEKRRRIREEELLASDLRERQQLTLAYVLKAFSSALDSQTAYFTPSEAAQFMIQIQQKLFGIGAQLRDDLNGFTVVRILEGSPAGMENKLKIGDRVIAVNHEPVVGMEITEAVELIRGQQGTGVVLTLVRAHDEQGELREEIHEVEIIRGEIVLKESRLEAFHEPFGDGVIGILHLFSFYQDAHSSSASDLREEIEALKERHNLKGIILDLRNNGGGFLPQAVAVTGLFIKKGIVVSVKDNSGSTQHLRNIEERIAWDGPLIVLTNRFSASASEIVAQTLQDYGRAIVVGDEETYGKGTIQSFTLESANYGRVNPEGEYKVTRGRYYTVSGKSTQLVGVQSDLVVPGLYSKMEIGEKFSRFPLDTDRIPANFDDALDDIPAFHRPQIIKLYKYSLQPILTQYTDQLDQLRMNSKQRMLDNKNYQNFIEALCKKEFVSEAMEAFGETDLQLAEATSVMKDLIYLQNRSEKGLTVKAG